MTRDETFLIEEIDLFAGGAVAFTTHQAKFANPIIFVRDVQNLRRITDQAIVVVPRFCELEAPELMESKILLQGHFI